MITFEDAYKIVKKSVKEIGTETIPFSESVNRVLAEDVKSDIEMPPFDKSAVDGFACKEEDLDMTLEVIEVVQAGQTPSKKVKTGQCTQIMTGAPVPKGANTVVMVEHTKVAGKQVTIKKKQPKTNISYQAEDVIEGQTVLKKSIIIKPQHIAIFASVGYTNVLVYKKVRVGIISTGDELVEPNEKPGISKIRNSNGHQLMAQVAATGATPVNYGIAKDTYEDTFKIVTKALSENDIILLTGGVSVGEFDFVPEVLKKAGIKILFDSIAVTPGKPTTFGKSDTKFCFGLPGNPVSSFVQFELLTKPFIYGMMGYDYKAPEIKLPVAKDYSRKRTSRKAFIPVHIKNGKVERVEYHGSAHIHALSSANGIISFPIGKETLKKGELVDVRQI
ncbi:MAG: molybdopterin molybdotransferase MoeA [Bacteroidales bacterium]|nr:molybdopterin molybdotransferase MoeA [Bacteroidales bacterium]